MNLKEKAILFLDNLLSLEYKHKRNIIDSYEDVGTLFENPTIAINYIENNISSSLANTFKLAINSDFIDKTIKSLEDSQVIVVTEESEDYPYKLYNLDFRPIVLYCKGDVKLLNSPKSLAMVGSRKTNQEYLKLSTSIASKLSKSVTIVSGVAVGGDKACIMGAKESGNLILVLAGGFNYVNSETNRSLIEETYKHGLVITEYPLSSPCLAFHYPVRNRIIAGLSDAILVISGSLTSGTRHTVNYGLEYGKDIMCFPYSPLNNLGAICNYFIKEGANLVENEEDIAKIMGVSLEQTQKINLNEQESLVYNAILNGNTLIDDISNTTKIEIYELLPTLTFLELKGLIIKGSGNEYYISRK